MDQTTLIRDLKYARERIAEVEARLYVCFRSPLRELKHLQKAGRHLDDAIELLENREEKP